MQNKKQKATNIAFFVNNIFMQGRVFGIKKSFILAGISALLFCAFVALSLVSILACGQYSLWFFLLCACCGGIQLSKAALFKLDSAFYFGSLLCFVSATGFYSTYCNASFASVFYFLSFAAAAYFTFVFFKQKFQLFASILLYLSSIFWFLFKINLISIYIFVALTLADVLIFILLYWLINLAKRKRS